MAVETKISTHLARVTGGMFSLWAPIAIAVAVLLNLVMLLAYQHALAADFPFQDEIGYLNLLHRLPETGFFHYLFDRYYAYYIPMQLFIWYGFYKLTHLNIEAVRYTGAAVSALVALLTCVMLYRKALKRDVLTVLVILCAPFVICSYNHWASYGQSIQSLMEPLFFGVTLTVVWIGEKVGQAGDGEPGKLHRWGWFGLFIFAWLIAIATGPSALPLVASVVVSFLLLSRRMNVPFAALSIAAIAVPAWYVIAGKALHSKLSAAQAFDASALLTALDATVSLIGNAVFSPLTDAGEFITRALGAFVVCAMVTATVYAVRQPAADRSRFMVPLTLTLFTALTLFGIIATRLHSPNLGFTPRYTVALLSAPTSLLFWFIALPDSLRWRKGAGAALLFALGLGVWMADAQTLHQLPYTQSALARVRTTMLSLKAEPTPEEQAAMYVNGPLLPFVYPDLQFLRREHLAMYIGQQSYAAPISEALTILNFGPADIKAQVPFNVQHDGASVWMRMSGPTDGEVSAVINGTKLRTRHHDDIVTAIVPARLYAKRGTYKMFVLEITANHTTIKSRPVDFVVH